jgi:hypothetical protein
MATDVVIGMVIGMAIEFCEICKRMAALSSVFSHWASWFFSPFDMQVKKKRWTASFRAVLGKEFRL